MTEKEISNVMGQIVKAICDAGFNPYDQLYGYVETGNIMYITRRDNAREKIQALSKEEIKSYLKLIRRS